jgi:hypothetical protein
MARENMTAIARPRPERGQARRRSQLLLPAFALVLGVAGTTAGAGAPGRTRPTAPASSAYRAAPMTGSSRDTGSRDTGSRGTSHRMHQAYGIRPPARPRAGPVISYRPTFFTAALPSMTMSPRWL